MTTKVNLSGIDELELDVVGGSSTATTLQGKTTLSISTSGSGSVTNVSTSNLSPIFTSSIANPTTTPAISFALSNVGAGNEVFASPDGSSGAPSYRPLVANDIPSLPESKIVNLVTDLAAKENIANKGIANGYASLDSGGKLPTSQLPTVDGGSF